MPALIAAHRTAKNTNVLFRYHIAESLGQMGPDAKDGLPLLREFLMHSSSRVREAAALAIYKIEKP